MNVINYAIIDLYVNYVIVTYRKEATRGFEASDVCLHSKRDQNAVLTNKRAKRDHNCFYFLGKWRSFMVTMEM